MLRALINSFVVAHWVPPFNVVCCCALSPDTEGEDMRVYVLRFVNATYGVQIHTHGEFSRHCGVNECSLVVVIFNICGK